MKAKFLTSLWSCDESGQREDYIIRTELEAWCWIGPAELKHHGSQLEGKYVVLNGERVISHTSEKLKGANSKA